MITCSKKMAEYVKGHVKHAEDTLDYLRVANEDDYKSRDVSTAQLFHYTRLKGMQDMFAQLVGVRHLLELSSDGMLNSPISSYQEYDIAGVRECIPMLRQGVNKVAIHSREIHDLIENLKKQYGTEDEE